MNLVLLLLFIGFYLLLQRSNTSLAFTKPQMVHAPEELNIFYADFNASLVFISRCAALLKKVTFLI